MSTSNPAEVKKNEDVEAGAESLELSEENLEDVAGGRSSCIPVEPITSDVLPVPKLPSIEDLL